MKNLHLFHEFHTKYKDMIYTLDADTIEKFILNGELTI